MKRWNYKKICCVCLSAILLTCTVPQVYGKTVSELEAEREELSKQTEEALAAIEDLESKQLSVEEEMDAMDQAMNSLQAEMDAAQEELDRIEASLEQSQKDLEEATKKRDEQFDLLCKRLKYLQQKGAEGYMEILLEAQVEKEHDPHRVPIAIGKAGKQHAQPGGSGAVEQQVAV